MGAGGAHDKGKAKEKGRKVIAVTWWPYPFKALRRMPGQLGVGVEVAIRAAWKQSRNQEGLFPL